MIRKGGPRLRVLFFNQYFPPDRSATASAAENAVAALTARGHHVTVIAGRPSYRPEQRERWCPLRRDVLHDAQVLRVGSTAFNRARMIGRVLNYLTYCALSGLTGIPRRTDVVLSMTDPPLAVFIARLVAHFHRVPLVYWVQDLHPDMALAAGLVSDNRVVAWWRHLHARVLDHADAVVVLGEDMADRVVAAGAAPTRVHVIPSGATLGSDPDPADRQHPLASKLRGGADFVVMHAGNLGYAGAWESLIEAAALCDEDALELVFLGEGPERRRLERLGRGKPVRFEDFRPPSEARYFMAAGDVQVVTLRPELTGVLVPSKLYGILAAGRPVLALASEDAHVARLVRRHNCGFVADPTDPVAVARILLRMYRNRTELANMGSRAREAAHHYDVTIMLAQLAKLVERTAGASTEDSRSHMP